MANKASTEEMITIMKGSTDTLHIRIPYNPVYIQCIRQVTGRRWEPQLKVWTTPYTVDAVKEFIRQFDPKDVEVTPELWIESEDLQQWKVSSANNNSWNKEPLQ